jgi:hypothetical protein
MTILDILVVIASMAAGVAVSLVSHRIGRARQRELDEPRMRPLCEEAVKFVDGELPPHVAKEFRAHLKRCLDCQREVAEGLRLSAQLSTLGKGDV